MIYIIYIYSHTISFSAIGTFSAPFIPENAKKFFIGPSSHHKTLNIFQENYPKSAYWKQINSGRWRHRKWRIFVSYLCQICVKFVSYLCHIACNNGFDLFRIFYRALSSLRGLRGAPEVPSLCGETQSLGQQMLNAPFGINGLRRHKS